MTTTLPLLFCLLAWAPPAEPGRPFAIEVVDAQTGRGVPLVELRTVHCVRLVTDSNGIAAFREPGLMGQSVFFHVRSHGYEFAADGFGFRGKALEVREGGAARLTIRRINIAERLYRVTGAGIYRDSALVGRPAPTRRPLLNAKVLGSDSVVNAVYRGRISWFWGDTNRPDYPLGNFQVPGATSALPGEGGLAPGVGVDLVYDEGPDGFARPTAPIPGEGPTWIDGLVVLKDGTGRERMFAAYAKIRNVLEAYERGLAEFDDRAGRFEKVATFPLDAPALPAGHPLIRTVGGVEYVEFATPYPLVRVRADPESLRDPARYEAFTCLVPGSRPDDPRVERGDGGTPRYGWKAGTPATGREVQAKLLERKRLEPGEALLPLRDAASGRAVAAHGGSVYWNAYRGRWVMIAVEVNGSSYLGEVWFAEADTPRGPWVYARKIATHDRYSFYNPKQHPMFDEDGGRVVYFEGTYTQTFSGSPDATPLYDYNQVMYRLDLSDPRLNLPVPVYEGIGPSSAPGVRPLGSAVPAGSRIAFFALERPAPGTVPVSLVRGGGEKWSLKVGGADEGPGGAVLFHALAADAKDPPRTTVPLVEAAGPGGERTYSVATSPAADGAPPGGRPVCRVWANPFRVAIPFE